MHYDRHYMQPTKAERDTQAIKDIREYLSTKQWDVMMQIVGNPATTIDEINVALGFTGVTGYPFHAFCRQYMLDKYRAWMAAEPDGVETDEQGFTLPT